MTSSFLPPAIHPLVPHLLVLPEAVFYRLMQHKSRSELCPQRLCSPPSQRSLPADPSSQALTPRCIPTLLKCTGKHPAVQPGQKPRRQEKAEGAGLALSLNDLMPPIRKWLCTVQKDTSSCFSKGKKTQGSTAQSSDFMLVKIQGEK